MAKEMVEKAIKVSAFKEHRSSLKVNNAWLIYKLQGHICGAGPELTHTVPAGNLVDQRLSCKPWSESKLLCSSSNLSDSTASYMMWKF